MPNTNTESTKKPTLDMDIAAHVLAKELMGIKKPAEYRIYADWNGLICTPEATNWTNKDLSGLLAHVDEGLNVQISKFITKEEAEAFVSHFPKFVKVTVSICYNGDNDYWIAHFYVKWTSKVTGEHNEAGLKRTKKLVEILNTVAS